MPITHTIPCTCCSSSSCVNIATTPCSLFSGPAPYSFTFTDPLSHQTHTIYQTPGTPCHYTPANTQNINLSFIYDYPPPFTTQVQVNLINGGDTGAGGLSDGGSYGWIFDAAQIDACQPLTLELIGDDGLGPFCTIYPVCPCPSSSSSSSQSSSSEQSSSSSSYGSCVTCTGCTCGNGPGAYEVDLTVLPNSDCSTCAQYLGTYIVPNTLAEAGCTWELDLTGSPLDCDGCVLGLNIVLDYNGVSSWNFTFYNGEFTYTFNGDSFDCSQTYTQADFTYSVTHTDCQTFACDWANAQFTLTPIGDAGGCCGGGMGFAPRVLFLDDGTPLAKSGATWTGAGHKLELRAGRYYLNDKPALVENQAPLHLDFGGKTVTE